MENNQKILILGADGQLGQSFVLELERQGLKFLALTSSDLDITDFGRMNEVIRNYSPDYIINCAAYNNVDKAEEDWENAYLVNGLAVRNLAIISEDIGSVLIHYSTDYVFSGEKDKSYNIGDEPDPISAYGRSKLLGECFLRDFARKYYLIRLSAVFGNNPNASFPLKLLSWSKTKDVLEIVDDQVFSPTFVDDVVIATLELIETGQFGLYHMTNSGQCSRYEFAKYILDSVNWKGKCLPIESNKIETLAKRPKFSVLDSFPLGKVIGYKLPDWHDSVDKFLINIKNYE
ncbi:MAG: dTDP-4-dehydrorhamnose reductase [Candidatus Pacebacteria bacterium]|nr:dTDP-4-dehydrorhamnose reductase [Candidatus Paceibacterota bacterium]